MHNIRRPRQHRLRDGQPNRNKHNREKVREEKEEEAKEIEKEESKLCRDLSDEKEFPKLENRSQVCKDGKGENIKKKKSRRKEERT